MLPVRLRWNQTSQVRIRFLTFWCNTFNIILLFTTCLPFTYYYLFVLSILGPDLMMSESSARLLKNNPSTATFMTNMTSNPASFNVNPWMILYTLKWMDNGCFEVKLSNFGSFIRFERKNPNKNFHLHIMNLMKYVQP